MGHEVAIIYYDRRFRLKWRKIGSVSFQQDGVAVYGMFLMPLAWLWKLSFRLHQRFTSWIYDRLFRTYMKDHGKPDIIYAHYLWNISYVAVLKKYGIPLVGIEHWSGLTDEKLEESRCHQGMIGYGGADVLLAVSQSLRSHIHRHFQKNSIVVYDMLGQEFLPPPRKKISGKVPLTSLL